MKTRSNRIVSQLRSNGLRSLSRTAVLASTLIFSSGAFAVEPPGIRQGPKTYICQCKSSLNNQALCNHNPDEGKLLGGGTFTFACTSTVFEGSPGNDCKGFSQDENGTWSAEDGILDCLVNEITELPKISRQYSVDPAEYL